MWLDSPREDLWGAGPGGRRAVRRLGGVCDGARVRIGTRGHAGSRRIGSSFAVDAAALAFAAADAAAFALAQRRAEADARGCGTDGSAGTTAGGRTQLPFDGSGGHG